MAEVYEYLRGFNFASVTLRLLLAMLFGGMLGLDRAKKGRPAGFRTYMFVCMGAALTVLLSEYESAMLTGPWNDLAVEIGIRTDVSRFGAQVINGIGFLGAGTIIVTGHQEVKGLTTAAALWASACMGLAVGAGFYECVVLGFLLIMGCIHFFPHMDAFIVERSRNMNIYVEFTSLDDVGEIINRIKEQDAQIYSVDITREQKGGNWGPSAVFAVRLNGTHIHEQVLTAISELDTVTTIDEV